MIGISDGRDIRRYARGEREPHASTAQHLRNVYYLVSLTRIDGRRHDYPGLADGTKPEAGGSIAGRTSA